LHGPTLSVFIVETLVCRDMGAIINRNETEFRKVFENEVNLQ
jgi:hypothetical protein